MVITATLKDGKIVRLTPAENVIKNLLESIGMSPADIKEIISVFKVRKKARRAEKEGDSKEAKRLYFRNEASEKQMSNLICISERIRKHTPSGVYNTDNKKLLHDFHLLSRFNRKEVKSLKRGISDKEQFNKMIKTRLNLFFNDKLRTVAKDKFRKIEGIKESFVWGEH